MRHALAAASLLALLAACSSDDGDDCPIAGTYTVTGAAESGNTCPDTVNEKTTYTISPSGDAFNVEIQGVQGACIGRKLGACGLQGKCDVAVKDATDPNNAKGTLQFSWTFNPTGFKGTLAVDIPAATSLPGGCAGSSAQTGVRR